ncbi:uncharacterized protein [Procambarus clarkii]|uniref:uncharacterized protein n=1 Tax=Procambarus clarkii TaxID=6728 RepID=UPI001E6737DE|nr:uncharacterized protein LOC123747217 [Procambarus clarkii]
MADATSLPLLLLLLLHGSCVAGLDCTLREDEIACSSESKCVKLRYICDGDNDCAEGEDEDPELCYAFKSHYTCDKGEVNCRRNGQMECMRVLNYCQQSDPPCEGDVDPKMCRVLLDNTVQSFTSIILPDADAQEQSWRRSELLGDDLVAILNNTINHPDCPDMYTVVGEQCLSVFSVGKVSWGEARAFCKVINGDLLTFKSVSHFSTVLQHLQEHQLTTDFWLGGRQMEKGHGWTWIDESPMVLGSPYWAVRQYEECQTRNLTTAGQTTRQANRATCYHYRQAPEPSERGYCAALSYQHYFYMTDEDCLLQKSPLCVAV